MQSKCIFLNFILFFQKKYGQIIYFGVAVVTNIRYMVSTACFLHL